MSKITCKFGGSSLADAKAIRAAVAIIDADPGRRFIVPSAPGKRTEDDKKVTDILYGWFHILQDGLDPSQPIQIIEERFTLLARELEAEVDISRELQEIAKTADAYNTPDFLASRGEYLNALIMADVLKATFVDPSRYIKFDYEGVLDESTYGLLAEALSGDGRFVIPGFYGADPDGHIRTFSRGGSDVTGAVVARATHSDLYENWTDVSGFRMTDPRIVPNARRIEEITYSELRELAYMGASVIHDEAIFPLRKLGIPIRIVNTHAPSEAGTMILPQRESDFPICGIAARKGFTMINIEKALMNKQIGFGRKALSVLEDHGISFEHMPTGIDTISMIVKDEELDNHTDAVVRDIQRLCEPDNITITRGLALIATVGQGMNHHIGVAARLCTALAQANVNLRVIDQGSSEMNIIIGVEDKDLEEAVRAIYKAFEAWK